MNLEDRTLEEENRASYRKSKDLTDLQSNDVT
jgi:hypothetical protein